MCHSCFRREFIETNGNGTKEEHHLQMIQLRHLTHWADQEEKEEG